MALHTVAPWEGRLEAPLQGLSCRQPAAMQKSKTTAIRWRTRPAVSGFEVQIGCKTVSTSAVVILSTGFLPRNREGVKSKALGPLYRVTRGAPRGGPQPNYGLGGLRERRDSRGLVDHGVKALSCAAPHRPRLSAGLRERHIRVSAESVVSALPLDREPEYPALAPGRLYP